MSDKKVEFNPINTTIDVGINTTSAKTTVAFSNTQNKIPVNPTNNSTTIPVVQEGLNEKVLKDLIDTKQDKLVSGQNIKTINNETILGEGNIEIPSSEEFNTFKETTETDINSLQTQLDNLNPVATTGDYNDLINKPQIPSKTSDLDNDSGFVTQNVDNLTNYSKTDDFSTVAFTGNYNDLTNKPAIPSLSGYATQEWVNDQGYLTQHQDISGKQDKITSTNKLDYNLISNTPAIPKAVSALTNDVGYITKDYHDPAKQNILNAGENIKIIGNTISAINTDTVYTAGTGIIVSGDRVISINKDTVPTKDYVKNYHDDTKQNVISDIDTIRHNALLGSTALQYYVETDPTVPWYVKAITQDQINSWTNKSTFSGDYRDLTNKPMIPNGSVVAQWGFTKNKGTVTAVNNITPDASGNITLPLPDVAGTLYTTYTTSLTPAAESFKNVICLHKISKTGDYNDLLNKPIIPTIPVNISYFTNDAGYITTSYHDSSKQDKITTTNKIDYSLIKNTPSIPTKVSDLTNDRGYITQSSLATYTTKDYVTSFVYGYHDASKQDKITEGNKLDYSLIANTPSIPTKTSQLKNDSGFITSSYHDTTKQDVISDLATIRANAAKGATALQEEKDPTVPSHVKAITQNNINTWNNKSDFSGDYNDLVNKPNIPTKTSDLTNDNNFITSSYHDATKQDTLVAGANIIITGNVISATGGGGGEGVEVDGKLLGLNLEGKATINPLYRSGYIAVENIVKRNMIDRTELEVGTRCYVKNEDKFYKLTISTGDSKVWEDDTQIETFDRYASTEKYGTVIIGNNLTTDSNGKLTVDVATREEQGSSKPITAGAVYDILGDIKLRLENI